MLMFTLPGSLSKNAVKPSNLNNADDEQEAEMVVASLPYDTWEM